MSYDLYFHRRDGSTIEVEDFVAYFSGRDNYHVDYPSALYRNEDTGVYFVFECADDRCKDAAFTGQPAAAMVSINYLRPHIFGLEAEPELAAFVRRFDLTVEDPQQEGMDGSEYSRKEFLRAWNAGNDFGFRSFLASGDRTPPIYALSTEHIEAHWRWNRTRLDLQNQLGNDIFVPLILSFDVGGELLSGWGDGIPIALPLVDALVISRDRLAPRRFLRRAPDRCLVRRADAAALLDRFRLVDGDIPYRLLDYAQPPAPIVSFVTSLAASQADLTAIPVDKILNADLFSKAIAANQATKN